MVHYLKTDLESLFHRFNWAQQIQATENCDPGDRNHCSVKKLGSRGSEQRLQDIARNLALNSGLLSTKLELGRLVPEAGFRRKR